MKKLLYSIIFLTNVALANDNPAAPSTSAATTAAAACPSQEPEASGNRGTKRALEDQQEPDESHKKPRISNKTQTAQSASSSSAAAAEHGENKDPIQRAFDLQDRCEKLLTNLLELIKQSFVFRGPIQQTTLDTVWKIITPSDTKIDAVKQILFEYLRLSTIADLSKDIYTEALDAETKSIGYDIQALATHFQIERNNDYQQPSAVAMQLNPKQIQKWENAGFVISQDKRFMTCANCKICIFGLYEWMEPLRYHKAIKHYPTELHMAIKDVSPHDIKLRNMDLPELLELVSAYSFHNQHNPEKPGRLWRLACDMLPKANLLAHYAMWLRDRRSQWRWINFSSISKKQQITIDAPGAPSSSSSSATTAAAAQ
jgi:hypothetical protein